MVPKLESQKERRRAIAMREVLEAVADLGESFFDEALHLCDDEREAAALASARLVSALEREHVISKPLKHAA